MCILFLRQPQTDRNYVDGFCCCENCYTYMKTVRDCAIMRKYWDLVH